MYGILGDFRGNVKPWWIPGNYVFARIPEYDHIGYPATMYVVIARNETVQNIYGLQVLIEKTGWFSYSVVRPYVVSDGV
jgi:hypothetical protein